MIRRFRPVKCFLCITTLLAQLGIAANAQTSKGQLAQRITRLPYDDQNAIDAANNLVRVTNLWSKPLDWNAKGASIKEIVGSIKKALGKEAPFIEVRGSETTRSAFVLTQAPLGPTLTALAGLADYQVWVFSGRIVLSSEDNLSASEQEAIERGAGGEWRKNSLAITSGWSARGRWESVCVQILGAQIKKLSATEVQTRPVPSPPKTGDAFKDAIASMPFAPYHLEFGELNPAYQHIVQTLIDRRFTTKSPTILPQDIVCFNDLDPRDCYLFFRDADQQNPKLRNYGYTITNPNLDASKPN